MTKMLGRLLGAGVALVFAVSIAAAQTPVRVRGVIDKVDGKTLSVKTQNLKSDCGNDTNSTRS